MIHISLQQKLNSIQYCADLREQTCMTESSIEILASNVVKKIDQVN